jgi:hypothetical protein
MKSLFLALLCLFWANWACSQDISTPDSLAIESERIFYTWCMGFYFSVDSSLNQAQKRANAMTRALKRLQKGEINAFDRVSIYTQAYLGTGAGNYTDANDVSVLAQGQNMDGSKATKGDYIFASVGVFLPVIGGSAVKNLLEKVGSISVKNTNNQLGKIYNFAIKNKTIRFSNKDYKAGLYDFVLTNQGELRIGRGHYVLSEGADKVKGAGQIFINKEGKIDYIDNFSGHYRPNKEQLLYQTEILKAASLLADKFDVVYHD